MLMLIPTIGYVVPMMATGIDKLTIGSRGSPLALAQAETVSAALRDAHPGLDVTLEIIRTTGDAVQDRPLAEIGGKGLFTKEIETALLDRRIDLAVHSAKDMETHLPDGLSLTAALPREDPRDVFLSAKAAAPEALPAGSVVGTTSLRRRAQILNRCPELEVVSIRGNVDTRLGKLERGEVDATLLALAGLNRLRRAPEEMTVLPPETMLPAAAQGAIGIESRTEDEAVLALVAPINHGDALTAISVERALLAALGGSCRTPVGALAELQPDGEMRLRGLIAEPDGAWLHRIDRNIPVSDALVAGAEAGAELRRRAVEEGGERIFDA